MSKNKVVVDTNILISGFVFGGTTRKVIETIFLYHKFFFSPELLNEYRNVPTFLKQKNKITSFQLEILVSGIAAFVSQGHIVFPKERLNICRDKTDNMLLECCIAASADFLITGDKDLIEIDYNLFPKKIRKLKILTPDQFL
jgi:putative PIN family toxin of toxin-antitoxin system